MKNKFLIALLTLPFIFGLFLMLSFSDKDHSSEEIKFNENAEKLYIKTNVIPSTQKKLKKDEFPKKKINNYEGDVAILQIVE